ncbi:LysR family transcriptional regulator [Nocardia heshunensis]
MARELGCTQPAVSQHVKRLEKATGVRLLERHSEGVTPTAEGWVLYEAASEGMAGLDLAVRRLDEFARGEAGSVRVHTGATTIRHFMAGAIGEFRERFPRATLEFRTTVSSRQSFDALIDGSVDLAWVTIGGPVAGIEFRPVTELPWVLVVRGDDPLADRTTVSPADLADVALIRLPEHSVSRRHLDAALTRLGVRPRSETGATDWNTAALLAGLGTGHALVPALGYDGGDVRLLPVPFVPPLAVGWAARRWAGLPPLAREFAGLVEANC